MSPTQPRNLVAEVISIGDEMTSGARLDTNAQWLSRRLGELGVAVDFHSTVGDTLEHNVAVFRTACERADVVVATGGLGPTRDDLTREALAMLVGQPLERRDDAVEHIRNLFARRQREMPERNVVQAMFPRGSEQIFNAQGSAPGIDLAVAREGKAASRCFALPGVPAEMKRMFDEIVAARILAQSGAASCIRHLVMKFFGTGESDMEHRLGDMISRDRQPRVGITVSTATISLRITATGPSDEICMAMIERTRQEILRLVPEFYFGDGERFEQYHAIDDQLRQLGESLLVVELGDAAPLGDWFASLGQSPAYRGGLSLGEPDDLLRLFDCQSETAALDCARSRFGADWLLMVDRYPPVDRESEQPMKAKEVRYVVVTPQGTTSSTVSSMGGHPDVLQPRIAKAGMAWLRRQLGVNQSTVASRLRR